MIGVRQILPSLWCRVLQTRKFHHGIKNLSTTPDTYYSSQSGRVMRVPGSAGTRIHETNAVEWRSVPSRVDILRQMCLASLTTVEIWPGAAPEIRTVGDWSEFTTKFTMRAANRDDLQYVSQHQDIISFVDVYVSCDDHSEGLKIVADARERELQVRAYVCNTFQSRDGTATDPAVVQDTVVALADLDACSIIITDDDEKADEDSLRQDEPTRDPSNIHIVIFVSHSLISQRVSTHVAC
jgi:hypothetical protein